LAYNEIICKEAETNLEAQVECLDEGIKLRATEFRQSSVT
jgi:hypothetical protein